MHRAMRLIMILGCACVLSARLAQAEEPAAPDAGMDPTQEAAMAAMKAYGSPGESHKALEPFVGNWTYTATWWMAPDGPPQSMAGAATNSLIFDGRFLKQEVTGTAEGQPPFEGLGIIGYDNIRKEYQAVWLDNMVTGLMTSAGQLDATTGAITEEGNFSCPITGETHRWFRSVWRVVDQDHNTYESYGRTPEGVEFKSMELQYTRVPAPVAAPCPPNLERC